MAHKLSPAEKKEAMRAVPEEDPEFQIAPMIDILLVLLVFFMSIASTEVLQTNDAVRLPVAKDSKEANKGAGEGQTIINLLWSTMSNAGSVDLDGKVFAVPSEVIPELQRRITANPQMRVLVRADKDVRYEYTRQLLQAVGTSGVGNVTFSVVNKEGPPAAGTTASTQ